MGDRLFGVISGVGVQVREKAASTPIEDGPLGTSVMVGAFRSGPTRADPGPDGQWMATPSGKGDFERIYGGVTQYSEAPISAGHFYDFARGAGSLSLVRVTDGTEVKSALAVYDRTCERVVSPLFPATKTWAKISTITAANGGRWGGRRLHVGAILDLTSAILSTSSIQTGLSEFLENELAGSTIAFPSVDGETYKIVSNVGGLVVIEGAFSAAVQASTATTAPVLIAHENLNEITGESEGLAIIIGDDGAGAAEKFSLSVLRDGIIAREFPGSGLDSAKANHWLKKVKEDLSNYEIAGVDLFGGNPADPLQRPANWAGIGQLNGVTDAAPNVLNLQTYHWQRTGTGNPSVARLNASDECVQSTITITFTSATAFTISAESEAGTTALGTGVLSSFTAHGIPYFPEFMLIAGSVAAISGTIITILHRPLPKNLGDKGGLLYIAAAASEGDTLASYVISKNTHDSITLSPAVDLRPLITLPEGPSLESSTAGDYAITLGNTVIYDLGAGGGNVTLTMTLASATYTAAQVAANLNSLALAASLPGLPLVEFIVSDTDKLIIRGLHDSGAAASMIVRAAGTLNAIVGWPGSDTTLTNGVDAKISRLQWAQELGRGYDGMVNISDSDYEIALDTDPYSGALAPLLPLNTGLIKIAAPGVASGAVQAAVSAWAYTHNGLAITEIPDTVTTEAAAVAWHRANLAIGAAQDYAPCYWPSYGTITSPYGEGLYTTSILGAVMGMQARFAADNGGYHVAAAGLGASISPVFKSLTTGKRVLNSEILNGYGLNEVRQLGAAVDVFGGRIAGKSSRLFVHKRATISHIGRILQTNAMGLVFQPIDNFTFAAVKSAVRDLALPWWRTGWFSDVDGSGFSDQISIKVDAENNPGDERKRGKLNVGFALLSGVVDTSEQVIFTITPSGVSVA